MRRTHSSRATCGFTLLELMVVMIVLAILAGIMVPRLLGGQSREFEHTVDGVADMLTMYAQRSTLSRTPIGLTYDVERHEMILSVLEPLDEDGEKTDGEGSRWRPDRTVRPVELPDWIEQPEIRADGEIVDVRRGPHYSEPGRPRAMIEIRLEAEDRSATLTLDPHAIAPRRAGVDEDVAALREAIDLDQAGMTTEDW